MWVFGYGSLMWDGWEKQHSCSQRQVAELRGYRRSFSKASVKNWGSPANPGPTLNLEGDEHAVCIGIAFEFPAGQTDEVTSYLARREGKGFELKPLQVFFKSEQAVNAVIPIYNGPNVIRAKSLAELVRQVASAKGTSGQCRDYVHGIQLELSKLGLSDPVVEETWNAVQALE
jgi:cation transport protein ChaC